MRLFLLMLPLLATQVLRADNGPLEAWLKRQISISTLDCEFTQERKLPALKTPTTTPGRLSFSKPDKVRWQLGQPFATLVVSDGTTLTLIDSAAKSARRTGVDSPHAMRFSLMSGKSFGSPEVFYQAFEVIEARVAAGIHQYTLKSKDRRIRTEIPWIFLDIDPTSNELRALEMELKDKSRLRTIFHKPVFNSKLDDALFKPDLAGYEVR